MANKSLSEDEIKCIISVDTSKAQEAIHKLTKETKVLQKEEKERKIAMIELEAQGQKNSRRYKNLAQETDVLSGKIKENQKRIKELTKGLDVNAMSSRQLKKLAKELANTLDNMSQAANPEEYAELEKRLRAVRSRMSELKGSGKNISQEFDLTQSSLSKLKAVAVAFITVKLAGYLKDIGSNAYNTRKEFAKYEATLRNALQSQEKATNSMKMLQQLAQETPASLKEWTEAFIKLVNRGINPTSAELINLGDVASSQGKDLDQFIEAMIDAMTGENERLKEFGIRASKSGDTVKYTFRGVTTEVQNSEEAIKNYLLSLGKLEGVSGSMAVQMNELEGLASNFGDTMDSMWNKLGKKMEPFFKKALTWASDFVSDVSKAIEPLSDTFDSQLDKVVSLEATLPGMTKRYEELAKKVNRNATEQKELNSLVGQISTIVPSAITEWDKYGNAISINTGKVNQFLQVEKARLKWVYREDIKVLKEKKKLAEDEKARLERQNNKELVWSGGRGWGNTKDQGMRKMTEKEINTNTARIKELGADLQEIDDQLNAITGEGIEEIVKNRIQAQEAATAAQQRFNSMNKTMLSAWLKDEKNAADQHKEIAQQIYNTRFPSSNTSNQDKSDPNSVSLKNMESTHAAEVNEIRLYGQQKQQAEEEINLAILTSDKIYYTKRIVELEKFKAAEKNSSKQAEYQKQIVNDKTKLLNTEIALEKQAIVTIEKLRADDLANESETTKANELHYTKELGKKKITKEQFEMLMLSLDYSSAETRLAIEQRYLNDVNDLELQNGQLKSDAVKRANDAVIAADQSAANARAAQQVKLDDLTKDFKSQFKVTTVDEDYNAQKAVIEASYQSRKEMAEKNKLDASELDAAYFRACEQLESDHQSRIQSIRDQYGISTQQQRFDAELLQLKNARDQGLIVEEDYETAVQNIKRDSYKQQFDYFSDLFAGAVNALQQAEMDNVDAKYDAEIEAAQGNAEEVERLETEKAQKKLDIEKKYADINFAIKASQIIADTAVSIMKAIADLGPIAGPIAAALMGVTGAAQLVSANAERQKVKNMTLSGTSKNTGTRVATGRESGGSIDVRRAQDGKFFPAADYSPDARGFIDRPTVIVGEGPSGQSKEWVASNAAVQNPTVAPILNLLDKAQQAGTIRTLDLNQAIRANMAGFSSGGSISRPIATPSPSTPSPSTPTPASFLPAPLMEKFAKAIISIDENGIPASVSLTDFERAQQLRNRARSIGSKF